MYLDFEAGTPGNPWTPAAADTASHGPAPGTWGYFNGMTGLTHTVITSTNHTRRTSFDINGVVYTGSGTRGIRFDLTGAPAYEGLQWIPPATISDITISGVTYFGATGSTNFDHINIAAGSYVVMQQTVGGAGGTAGELHVESQRSGVTYKSASIPIDIGWYEWHLRLSATTGDVGLVVLDPVTGAVIGTSGISATDVFGQTVNYAKVQDYLAPVAGFIDHDNFVFAWGANALLPLSDITVPAAQIINLTQTAPGVNRLKWSGIGLAYRIERRVSGGSFSTIEAEFFADNRALEYLDTTVSNGVTYQYRITTLIGEQEATGTLTGEITVDNSPSGTESVWQTQALSNASLSMTETHTLSQKIKNTSAAPVIISEVSLDSEFFSRGSEEYLWLTENSDGSGLVYGISNALDIQGNGPLVFEFFAGASIPGNTNFYLFYAPQFARTQILYQNTDVYFPGQGFNGSYDNTGTLLGSTGALKFELKQREVISDVHVTTFRATTLVVG